MTGRDFIPVISQKMRWPGSRGCLALVWLSLAVTAPAVTIRELLAGPPAREIVYKQVAEGPLKLHAFLPARSGPDERRPAIVWIHGGAWVGGTLEGFMPHARYMAERGLVAFNLEYRLLKPAGPTMAECIADCQSAIRYLRVHAAELGIDPARIAVAGDSAGGHLTAALGTLGDFGDPAEAPGISARPDVMILLNPVLDLTEDDWIRYAVGGPALADRTQPRPHGPADLARARALSPIFHAHAGVPPSLLLHGLDDKIVPVSQARRFAEALAQAGVRCDLRLLEKQGHAFGIAYWRAPEPTVVETLRTIDAYLTTLGYVAGPPTLSLSAEPAWVPKPPAR
jgi:acetyl esterase/lipase